ncbi:ATP-binding cassette domain-containing protein [Bifidobacterium sp. MA2]|uniref:ATP-binding cassette domain-containing protein n=1 Tax=Bifidobacterium santillanense TaxID=2809028 RepID=A0ABS5UQ82_9BIFI|nr:ATP-binding cassette domain-containing protein [Bifidobacterium santillanense]MBT1173026.1 ATP-binding cassette domain-containing protein [Bifidobacterium santillanense]
MNANDNKLPTNPKNTTMNDNISMNHTPKMIKTNSPASLDAAGLTKSINGRILWHDLTFHIDPGTITAITGPSGAGKTTLLNAIGLLEPLDRGIITYGHQRLDRLGRGRIRQLYRNAYGFLFQNYALVDQWTVNRNLDLAMSSAGIPRSQRSRLASYGLDQVGLSDKRNAKVYTLSGGEQQRVAIARLLTRSPRIVLADEPTAALDPDNVSRVMNLLRSLADQGSMVIMTTHNPDIVSLTDQHITLVPNR